MPKCSFLNGFTICTTHFNNLVPGVDSLRRGRVDQRDSSVFQMKYVWVLSSKVPCKKKTSFRKQFAAERKKNCFATARVQGPAPSHSHEVSFAFTISSSIFTRLVNIHYLGDVFLYQTLFVCYIDKILYLNDDVSMFSVTPQSKRLHNSAAI